MEHPPLSTTSLPPYRVVDGQLPFPQLRRHNSLFCQHGAYSLKPDTQKVSVEELLPARNSRGLPARPIRLSQSLLTLLAEGKSDLT